MKNKAECRAIDEPLPPEFLEALNLCTKLISVRATGDPDRLTAANDSLRADLLGDPPVPTLISAADQPVVTLLHSFLELMQVPQHDTSPEAMGIKKWRRNEARRITLTVHSFDRDTGGGIFEVGGPAKRVPLGKPTFPKLPNMPSACDRPLCAQVGRMARLHACLLNEFSMLLAAEIGHHSGNVLLV